jgi:HlyD family secretion protein
VQNVVTYTAIISAANAEHLLLPNMTAELRIVVGDTGQTLKIPNQALRFHPDNTDEATQQQTEATPTSSEMTSATVWVVDDGRPRSVPVEVGLSDDNHTQLLDGPLGEGQRLIVGVSNAPARSQFLSLRMGF